MKTILYWLTSRLPCRIISDDGRPYLERYYVGTLFGVRFYLHRFVGSDPARGLHDHPWSWARSIILSGWYYEQRRDDVRSVHWYNKLSGDTFHRVLLPVGNGSYGQPEHCWTLFFHKAEYVKPWGFWKTRPADPWINGAGKPVAIVEWRPWNFPKNGTGTSKQWWLTAPLGRDEARRAAK